MFYQPGGPVARLNMKKLAGVSRESAVQPFPGLGSEVSQPFAYRFRALSDVQQRMYNQAAAFHYIIEAITSLRTKDSTADIFCTADLRASLRVVYQQIKRGIKRSQKRPGDEVLVFRDGGEQPAVVLKQVTLSAGGPNGFKRHEDQILVLSRLPMSTRLPDLPHSR